MAQTINQLTKWQKYKLFLEPTDKIILNVVVTFIEAFLPAWALTGYSLDKGTVGGALGAAGAVTWNTALKPLAKQAGIINS
jgi:hypothetical protein